MITKRLSVLACISALLLNHSSIIHAHDDAVHTWEQSYLNRMTAQELQVTANYLYFVLSTVFLEWQIRQFPTAIAKLNQSIRDKIAAYQNPAQDIALLRTLFERLSYVVSARTIYIQTLTTCATHFNNDPEQLTQLVQAALLAFQTDSQQKLADWADEKSEETAKILKKSSDFIGDNMLYLHNIGALHKEMSEGKLPIEITPDGIDKKSLIAISVILQQHQELIAVAEGIVNIVNESHDYASQLLARTVAIYKDYYTALHNRLTSPIVDSTYTTTMFSMYGILADEYKTVLPDADHLFEHILHTTKMYTQIELSQQ